MCSVGRQAKPMQHVAAGRAGGLGMGVHLYSESPYIHAIPAKVHFWLVKLILAGRQGRLYTRCYRFDTACWLPEDFLCAHCGNHLGEALLVPASNPVFHITLSK